MIYRRYASLYFIMGLDLEEEVTLPAVRTKWPTFSLSITSSRQWISTSKMSANWTSCIISKKHTTSSMKWSWTDKSLRPTKPSSLHPYTSLTKFRNDCLHSRLSSQHNKSIALITISFSYAISIIIPAWVPTQSLQGSHCSFAAKYFWGMLPNPDALLLFQSQSTPTTHYSSPNRQR